MTTPTNPFTYGTDPELNVIFDKLIGLKTRVAAEFAKAEKIAGFGDATHFIPAINGAIALPNYRDIHSGGYNSYRKTALDVVDQQVQAALKVAKEHVADVKAQNVPIVAHNQKICDQVTQIMTRLGIPSSYTTYEYASSRSRTKKSIPHTAGYLGDLSRNTPKSNVSTLEYQITEYERSYNNWVKETKDAERKARIESDNETVNKKILGNPKLVATLMQAGVNILAEVQNAVPGEKAGVIDYCMAQAIQNTVNKDKYLKLYYELRLSAEARNRPEALPHAQNAINAFYADSNNPTDVELKKWVDDCITNWDHGIGGRCWRDNTPWNLGRVIDLTENKDAKALLGQLDLLEDEI